MFSSQRNSFTVYYFEFRVSSGGRSHFVTVHCTLYIVLFLLLLLVLAIALALALVVVEEKGRMKGVKGRHSI